MEDKGINVLSLFDGMSCGMIALERAGIKVDNYYASEIDKYAIKISETNFPDIIRLGDVRNVTASQLPKIDLLIGGSPCQTLSIAGNGTGFDGKSGLFFEYVRILNEVKPKYFLLENVKMRKEHQKIITERLGVEPVLIDSGLVSAQTRKRLYWSNIPGITQPENKNVFINDIFNEITFKDICQTMDKITGKEALKKAFKKNVRNVNQKHKTLGVSFRPATSCGCNILYNDKWYMATPEGAEELQTVPRGFTSSVSTTRRFGALGNGWTVDVIAHIFKSLTP